MKERELREHAICNYCLKKIGECGIPGFFTVDINSYSINIDSVTRQDGFAAMITPALARVMGSDRDLADQVESLHYTMCWACYVEKMPVAAEASDE